MTAINIGSDATNRATSGTYGYTVILKASAANATGKLTSIEVWAASNISGLKVGTFYVVSGTTYKCRDVTTIGSVTAGSKQTFTVSLNVTAGDLLGYYFTGGSIERDNSGSGDYYINSDHAILNNQVSYTLENNTTISLKGIGSDLSVPTVTTGTTTDITTTTATGNGNITATGGENCTKRGICYSKVNNPPTTSDSKIEESGSFGTGAFTENLTGLDSGTTYHVRAYAINSAGTSYGSVDTFDTIAIVVPSVTTNAASSLSQTSATLNGEITATGGENSTVRGFVWDTISHPSNPGAYLYSWNETGSYGTGTFNHAISGLWAGTIYYFRAYATNSAGTTYGDELTLTTLAGLPFNEVELSDDDQWIYNRGEVIGKDGAGNDFDEAFDDATAQANQGIRALVISDSLLANPADAFSQAYMIPARYADSKIRAESLLDIPDSSPAALYPALLDREISDRITLQLNSTRNPALLNENYHIEGIEFEWNASENQPRFRFQLWDVNQFRFFGIEHDGYLINVDASDYTTCHDAASASSPAVNDDNVGLGVRVGQQITTGEYTLWRGYVQFDLTSLTGATLSAVSLLIWLLPGMEIDNEFDLTLVGATGVANPLEQADYGDLKLMTTDFGHITIPAGLTQGGWYEIALNATGIAAITQGAVNGFGLRSSKDIAATSPGTFPTDANEWIEFKNVLSDKPPRLIIKVA